MAGAKTTGSSEKKKPTAPDPPREKQPAGDPATKAPPQRKPPKPAGPPGKGFPTPTKPASPRKR